MSIFTKILQLHAKSLSSAQRVVRFAFGFCLSTFPIALLYWLELQRYMAGKNPGVLTDTLFFWVFGCELVAASTAAFWLIKRYPAISLGIAVGVLYAYWMLIAGSHLMYTDHSPYFVGGSDMIS